MLTSRQRLTFADVPQDTGSGPAVKDLAGHHRDGRAVADNASIRMRSITVRPALF